jgi:hypothetical protein
MNTAMVEAIEPYKNGNLSATKTKYEGKEVGADQRLDERG